MKKRKKSIFIGVIVLSLALLVGFGVTVACGPRGHWHKGFHSRFHSEDVADFILWKMDKHVKQLDLNETQTQKYEKIKDQVKLSITEAAERRREFHRIIHDEIDKEKPDLNIVAKLAKERLQKIPESIGRNLDLFMGFYNRVLNDEQKTKVIEMIRSRMI